MLLEQRSGGGGRVSVLTRNPKFNRLLQTILAEWHFITEADAASVEILLLERGLPVPAGAQRVIWLTPMPLDAEPCLEVPLSLTELYHYLELQFFPQPRHHIRLPLDQPIDVNVRGVWLVGRLLSLSDRGARIISPALLPKRERLLLDIRLEGYPLRLTGEVLYDIPAGDVSGRELPQAGLLFKPPKPALRKALRHFIERRFVDLACQKTGIAASDPSLSWFRLVKNPWEELSG
jgi:hypothetical protein